MRLILVRHGQTSSNISRALDTTEPGPDLTNLGRAQAAALPRMLDGTPIEAIYASTLVRTQQTAAPLAAAHGLDVQVRAGLREVSAGELEMRFDAVARANVPNGSTVVLDGNPANGWHAMTWDGVAVP